jgi:hypothetical protein
MHSRFSSISIVLAAGMIMAPAVSSQAPQTSSGTGSIAPASAASGQIPDAPTPQIELAADSDPQSGQAQSAPQPASVSDSQPTAPSDSGSPGGIKNGATQSSSQSSSSQQPSESHHDKAAEQIKEEEQQRVVGIVPEFNTTYHWDAASMTAGQKMGLALRTMTDPFQFGAAFLVAGYHEALNDDPGFGWGWEGFGKRSGAAYLDAFDGSIIGNGILPALLHQDPRYFRMGHGTIKHRMLYALATNVICRHDNTGKWEPNYSNVGGNIIAGAISNLYYPSQNSGWGQTFSNGLIVTAEGGIGSIFQEFWPDLSRKFLHRDPTHGLDAQAKAADENKRESKNNSNANSGDGSTPAQP